MHRNQLSASVARLLYQGQVLSKRRGHQRQAPHLQTEPGVYASSHQLCSGQIQKTYAHYTYILRNRQPSPYVESTPGASAVIYGRVEAKGIVFDGVADALRVPNSDIRLFGKPESFVKRRMGVALAFDADLEVARVNAKKAAGMVKPRAA